VILDEPLSGLDPVSARTDELLVGKLIGLAGAGLMQVGIYVLLLVVPGIMVLAIIQVPMMKLALALVYFVLGYTLFASLMTGTGMLGRSAQESAQLSAIWTRTSASPIFFLAAISAAPNGALARVLSFFPLTAPVTMMIRLSSTRSASDRRARIDCGRRRRDILRAPRGVEDPARRLADVRETCNAAGAGPVDETSVN
jgi:ABC-type Na+ efflux pump permease subunit